MTPTEITQTQVFDALINIGGNGTSHEVCVQLNVDDSWSRELVSARLNQLATKGHVEKISITSLGRPYKTKNIGVCKWAYKVNEIKLKTSHISR